ncbi:MAG TPA: hypothetical protein VI636_23485, partial [Candidatus Angelobacter sp.]
SINFNRRLTKDSISTTWESETSIELHRPLNLVRDQEVYPVCHLINSLESAQAKIDGVELCGTLRFHSYKIDYNTRRIAMTSFGTASF